MKRFGRVFVIVAAGAAALSASAQAAFPGRNGSLIAAYDENSPIVRAVNPSNGHARTIFSCHLNSNHCPDYPGDVGVSSDGRKLAFAGTTAVDSRVNVTNTWVLDIASRTAKKLPLALGHTDGFEYDDSPAWFPGAPRIIFSVQYQSDTHGLYTSGSDGSGVRRLLACDCGEPVVSPNGKLILFDRGAEIWIANSDGSNPRRFARHAEQPSWAPSGRKVAFVSLAHGNDLVTESRNRRHRHLLAHNAFNPVWSPNGRLVAFTRAAKGPNNPASWILTVRASGGGVRKLFRDSPHSGSGITGLDWQALPN